ncbi:PLC-like phosphodiesterase [Mycena indigotica]|uniref:PLC-like phosphodiesterase n=1 Tax=Mycena indigotica TaxID=2126181 RepID=A0A8H6W878_9AGAR|nr:PLC-like phosphodiesterase [Mycena indigotica]KAF7306601.1 PLC-like phosphodiesterase [Mycena indigotica]
MFLSLLLLSPSLVLAVLPLQQQPFLRQLPFDVQGHRGGRGNAIENTLPGFAWGLIDGATTLELDNGITKDGVVVVWHDQQILPEKCLDTAPATPGDPYFPYVGKFLVDLTLAQLQTLDCGSQRQTNYPLQLTYPGTRISTLEEVFAFVECADPERSILWNIESKIDAVFPERTASVQTFVTKQHEIFAKSSYKNAITFQGFDWRSLVAMRELDPQIVTSALAEYETTEMYGQEVSPWLAGVDLAAFSGSFGVKLAQAAHAINATILSPSAFKSNLSLTTKEMVDRAHELGIQVKPWTVNSMDVAQDLLDWGIDGMITDYPNMVRRFVQQQGRVVAPKYPKRRVLSCLEKYL